VSQPSTCKLFPALTLLCLYAFSPKSDLKRQRELLYSQPRQWFRSPLVLAFNMSSVHTSPHPSRSPASASPTSSGAVTPADPSAGSPTFLSSSVSGLWGGLIRRFSSETTPGVSQTSQPHPSLPSALHHASTFNGVDGVYQDQQVHRQASPMRLPPLEPLVLKGFRDDTPSHSRLLTPAIAEEIRIMVPARLGIGDEWDLVYSLDQDGASLATLYEKCSKYQGKRVGFVLVIKDNEGGVSAGCPS